MSDETKTSIREEEIWDVLTAVTDPEIGVDIVNLGLIYGIEIDGSNVNVRMTLTSMGCPATGLIEFQVKEAAGTVEGVENVTVEFTFEPAWSPERMTEEGRDMMAAMGFM